MHLVQVGEPAGRGALGAGGGGLGAGAGTGKGCLGLVDPRGATGEDFGAAVGALGAVGEPVEGMT